MVARVVRGVEPGSAPVIPVDRSSPGSLVLTARYHLATNGHDDARALAAALAALPHQNDPYLGSLVSESQAEIDLLLTKRQSLKDHVARLEAQWDLWSGSEAQ